MFSVLIHIQNDDPVLGEMEALPGVNDTLVILKNPRRRDGKDISYMEANVSTAMWPVTRINFIEVLPSRDEEEIISFVREKDT
jgi:hypothetical protein